MKDITRLSVFSILLILAGMITAQEFCILTGRNIVKENSDPILTTTPNFT